MKAIRNSTGRLLVDCLPMVASTAPAIPRKTIGNGNYPKTFGVKSEHEFCANVRRCSKVNPNETNALARVLRATAQYSICDWAKYICPLNGYVPVTASILKALGISTEGQSRIEEGSRGVFC